MFNKLAFHSKEFIKLFYSPLRSRQKSAKKQLRTKYAKYYAHYPVQTDLILYESSYGRGLTCNPYAIFKAFLRDELFTKFRHVWVLENLEEHQELRESFKDYPNVSFVQYESDQYLKYLVSAKYLINNTSFASYFAKKKEQIYLNTWHSITVKKLAFDLPQGRLASGNMLRNLLAADYIISANRFTTQIFKEAFKLAGLYQGKIIENGYPRNDLLLQTPRTTVIKKLQALGIAVEEDKEIILYAPTWRGNNFFKPDDSITEYVEVLTTLQQQLDTSKYQILIKPHPAVDKHITPEQTKQHGNLFIPGSLDTNELLAAVDILISDYSSIFFDFMLTNRPILFYIPDLEQYQDQRGTYFSLAELPGPASKKLSEISSWIIHLEEMQQTYHDIYAETKAWVCEYDDGQVSEKILDIVFRRQEEPYNVLTGLPTTKKKLLIYASRLKTNGVTSSLINLLQHLDYEQFDVSLIATKIKQADVIENVVKLPPQVRVFARNGTYSAALGEDIRNQLVRRYGLRNWFFKKIFPQQLFQREFSRCFGNSQFDYVLDFSGYGPFFAYLLLQATGAKRFIWQHSDLWVDQKRVVSGQEKTYYQRQAGIKAAFSLYPYFDKIVACGEAIMEVNRKNLATPATYAKFTCATNLVDSQRIAASLQQPPDLVMDSQGYLLRPQAVDHGRLVLGEVIKLPAADTINFVTMGRLSPEKNQKNLINAFAQLHAKNANCRLYIIGEGDLRPQLEKLIAKLNLQEAVFLVGSLTNPFIFLKACHCFVFPSFYEGQGLVVLEARMVGLPIIIANYGSVRDVCSEKGQLVIDHDVQSIYQGLKAFLAGQVPADYRFDPESYNQKCYEEFTKLFF
ncbi:MAG TPA: glycosyltransferase [Oscillospiraceae bacterium]|nr:glycosyltransferase [Oscillospiraceae bacterium]